MTTPHVYQVTSETEFTTTFKAVPIDEVEGDFTFPSELVGDGVLPGHIEAQIKAGRDDSELDWKWDCGYSNQSRPQIKTDVLEAKIAEYTDIFIEALNNKKESSKSFSCKVLYNAIKAETMYKVQDKLKAIYGDRNIRSMGNGRYQLPCTDIKKFNKLPAYKTITHMIEGAINKSMECKDGERVVELKIYNKWSLIEKSWEIGKKFFTKEFFVQYVNGRCESYIPTELTKAKDAGFTIEVLIDEMYEDFAGIVERHEARTSKAKVVSGFAVLLTGVGVTDTRYMKKNYYPYAMQDNNDNHYDLRYILRDCATTKSEQIKLWKSEKGAQRFIDDKCNTTKCSFKVVELNEGKVVDSSSE